MFLPDVFDGDEDLASAVDHLLVVGFYLVDLGYVSIALKTTDAVVDAVSAIEALSVSARSCWCSASCTWRTSPCSTSCAAARRPGPRLVPPAGRARRGVGRRAPVMTAGALERVTVLYDELVTDLLELVDRLRA